MLLIEKPQNLTIGWEQREFFSSYLWQKIGIAGTSYQSMKLIGRVLWIEKNLEVQLDKQREFGKIEEEKI